MLFIFVGVISGIIAGMGMGGGTLLIPILTIFLSYSQIISQSINLLAFIPCAIVSLIVHFKNKLVDIKTALPITIIASIVSVFAASFANAISGRVLKIIFGVFLICIGLYQLIDILCLQNKNKSKQKTYKFVVGKF